MGNWDGNYTIFGKLRIAPALPCRCSMSRTCVNYQNHSKNDGSTNDSIHKIIIFVCGLENLRCVGGWGGGYRLGCACEKHRRNGF